MKFLSAKTDEQFSQGVLHRNSVCGVDRGIAADIRHGTLGIVFSMNCQEMPPPPTQMRLVYIWVKRRRLSATEVVHGPHKSIRTNFRMGGVMGVVMALGHISRYRHAPTHRYRPKIPSSNIQEGI